MAKQAEGFLGGFNGRLGPVVGYRWKGVWCVRAQSDFVRNPRTAAQQAHRALFKAEVQLAGRMRWALNTGLKLPADEMNMTPMNLFVKANQQAFSEVEGRLAVDYPSLRISGGTVAPVALTEASVDEDNVLNIRFEKNPLRRTCGVHDNVYFWIYSEELEMGYLANPVYRRVQQAHVALPDMFRGYALHIYAFAQDDAGRCSETAYIGCGYGTVSAEVVDEETGEITAAEAPQRAAVDGGGENIFTSTHNIIHKGTLYKTKSKERP
jgi:hypothetical protein